jgi:hypothetical protein
MVTQHELKRMRRFCGSLSPRSSLMFLWYSGDKRFQSVPTLSSFLRKMKDAKWKLIKPSREEAIDAERLKEVCGNRVVRCFLSEWIATAEGMYEESDFYSEMVDLIKQFGSEPCPDDDQSFVDIEILAYHCLSLCEKEKKAEFIKFCLAFAEGEDQKCLSALIATIAVRMAESYKEILNEAILTGERIALSKGGQNDRDVFAAKKVLIASMIDASKADSSRLSIKYAKLINSISFEADPFEMQKLLIEAKDIATKNKMDSAFFDEIGKKLKSTNSWIAKNAPLVGIDLSKFKAPKEEIDYEKMAKNIYCGGDPERSINFLLATADPFSKKAISELMDEYPSLKNTNFVNHQNGRVARPSELSEDEWFSLQTWESQRGMMMVFSGEMSLFHECFENFGRSNDYVSRIIGECLFFLDEPDWQQETSELIEKVLAGKAPDALSGLCASFEHGLRNLFEANGISSEKMKPDSDDLLGLNDIFNFGKSNRYRDYLLKTIDEDYFFTLTWLLTDEFGGNLRNDLMHGILSPKKMNGPLVEYACIQMIKLIWAFRI